MNKKESLLTKDFQLSFGSLRGKRAQSLCPPLLVFVASSLLFFHRLTANKEADSFYSAGIWSGTQSWRAMLVGAVDPEMSMSTDKPSIAMWPSILLSRAFGFQEWTVLAPYAAVSVGVALVLYYLLHRVVGVVASLAGVTLWLCTPAAVLMARFNKPEPFLAFFVLLALLLALKLCDQAQVSLKLALSVGAVLGLAYLSKVQVAALVLPALLVSLLCFAAWPLNDKVKALAAATAGGLAMIVSWGVLAQIAVAGQNTWIDGTSDGNLWRMLFMQSSYQSTAGFTTDNDNPILRIFGETTVSMGSLFLPLALLGTLVVCAVCIVRRRANELDRPIIMLGLSLWVITLAFAFTPGVFHEYYVYLYTPLTAALTVLLHLRVWPLRRGRVITMTLLLFELSWILWAAEWGAEKATLLVFALLVGYPHVMKASRTSMLCFSTLFLALPGFLLTLQTYDHVYRGWAVGNGAHHITAVNDPIPGIGDGEPNGDLTKSKSYRGASLIPPDLTAYLREGGEGYRWSLATIDSSHSTAYEVAMLQPTLSIGAYWGKAPNVTVDEFQHLVEAKQVRYFIFSNEPIVKRLRGTEAEKVQAWVTSHYDPIWIADTAVYDLQSDPH